MPRKIQPGLADSIHTQTASSSLCMRVPTVFEGKSILPLQRASYLDASSSFKTAPPLPILLTVVLEFVSSAAPNRRHSLQISPSSTLPITMLSTERAPRVHPFSRFRTVPHNLSHSRLPPMTTQPEIEHIWVITGPAGCGKTTVAAYLSQELGYPYLEGDDVRFEFSLQYTF